jgi:hypothetical protein
MSHPTCDHLNEDGVRRESPVALFGNTLRFRHRSTRKTTLQLLAAQDFTRNSLVMTILRAIPSIPMKMRDLGEGEGGISEPIVR